MLKGCFFLLFLLVAGYFAEDFYLRQQAITFEWWIPALLSLGVTLTFSNIWGIWVALQQKRMSKIQPADWQDGQSIGVGGKLRPLKQALTSPVTRQQVVLYEYTIKRISGSGKQQSSSMVSTGFGMAPCAITTQRGSLRLIGFPLMNHYPSAGGSTAEYATQLGEYFSKTRFKEESRSLGSAFQKLKEIVTDADGDLKCDFVFNDLPFEVRKQEEITASSSLGSASRTPSTEPAQEDAEAAFTLDSFRSHFFGLRGTVQEQVVPAGADVAIFGTYRANPPRIDIGQALSKPNYGLFLGEIQRVTTKKLIQAVIISLIFGAITAAGHFYAYQLQNAI